MCLAHHLSASPLRCFGIEELCLQGNSIWVLKDWKWYLVLQLFWLLSYTLWGVEPSTLGTESQTWRSALSCTYGLVAKNTSATNWCSQSDMLEHVSFHSVTPASQTAPDVEHGLCTLAWKPAFGLQAKRPLDRMCALTNGGRASSLHALPCWPVWCSHQRGVCSMCGTPESARMWHESVRVCRSPCLTCMKGWWLAWLRSAHTVWKKRLL